MALKTFLLKHSLTLTLIFDHEVQGPRNNYLDSVIFSGRENFNRPLSFSTDFFGKDFSNFSRRFLNPNYFFPIFIIFVLNVLDLTNLQEQVKKAFCFKNCTDLSLFVLVVSKILQILQP